MTTKVLIAAENGNGVKVEVKGRNAKGEFTEVAEAYIFPGQFASFNIHGDLSLQVFELKEDEA